MKNIEEITQHLIDEMIKDFTERCKEYENKSQVATAKDQLYLSGYYDGRAASCEYCALSARILTVQAQIEFNKQQG